MYNFRYDIRYLKLASFFDSVFFILFSIIKSLFLGTIYIFRLITYIVLNMIFILLSTFILPGIICFVLDVYQTFHTNISFFEADRIAFTGLFFFTPIVLGIAKELINPN